MERVLEKIHKPLIDDLRKWMQIAELPEPIHDNAHNFLNINLQAHNFLNKLITHRQYVASFFLDFI